MRRHHRSLTPLAVLGVWIAIFVGFQASGTGIRSFGNTARGFVESTDDSVQVVSVMGRSDHVSRATAFRGANITNVMGRSDVDLRDATLAPGATASVKVFSMMGAVMLRVPPSWTVDTGAISAMGGVRDERPKWSSDTPDAAAGTPPRLVLRGVVAMGRLTIR
jgi:predicted membrane protein